MTATSRTSTIGSADNDLRAEFPTVFPSVRGVEPVGLLRGLKRLDDIGAAFGGFARSLLTQGRLAPDTRELVVLWVSWVRRCPYVFTGHLLIASDVGLRFPGPGEDWDPEKTMALAVADRLMNGTLDDVLRRKAARTFGRRRLLELALVAGQYTLLAMVVQVLGLSPEPGTPDMPSVWPGPIVGDQR